MLNKKRKGFTIVELVIVIAVIAILAAVLIPTFAGIIDKANESADKQAVRQMNIALAAESIENEPDDVGDVIDILAAAGFNSTDKLVPVSAKHGFYWSAEANMVTLIRDEGENSPALIFPTEEAALNTAFTAAAANWTAATTGANAVFFDLEPAAGGGTGGGTGGSGGPVTTAADLIAALEAGGEVTLGASIEITEAFSFPSETAVTIDLNGQTLTLKDNAEPSEDDASNVITVANGGVLTISNTGTGGGIVIEEPDYDYYWMSAYAGILVEAGGKLELDGVKLTINAYHTAIANNGEATLKNGANVTVTGGIGLYNDGTGTATISSAAFTVNDSGTGVMNKGEISLADTTFTINTGEEYYPTFGVENGGVATITGGSFVASGTHVTSVRNYYAAADPYSGSPEYIGKMTITGTVFSEAEVSTYEHFAPIEHSGSTSEYDHASECYLVLEGVQVSSSQNSVYVNGSGKVVINSGVFNSQLKIPAAITYIAIYGGTFHNGTAEVAFENLACVHSEKHQPDCGIFVADDSGKHGMHKYSVEGDKTCWYICYDSVKSQLPGTLIEEAPTP